MSRGPVVSLSIDRLVLRGFAPGERDAILRGLTAELRALLAAEGGALGPGRAVARLPARPAPIAPAAPSAIGAAAAQRIVGAIRS